MSHYHCEIVIPPPTATAVRGMTSASPTVADLNQHVERAIARVMDRFVGDPVDEDEDEEDDPDRFHDGWYVIGGYFAGSKMLAKCDPDRLQAFRYWLCTQKVTVASLISGKQRLDPASQELKVDAKWNEMFPSDQFVPCPLFAHSNDPFADGLKGAMPGDVMRLADVPPALRCYRLIVAAPSYNRKTTHHDGPLEAVFMVNQDGGKLPDRVWNHGISGALELYRQSRKRHDSARCSPTDEWLAVTVDYHR